MLVIDSQVHVWQAEDPEHPWPQASRGVAETHRPPLSPEVLIPEMDAAGVDRAVLVPPFFTGFRADYALKVAVDHPDRFRVMPRLDVRADDAREQLDRLREHPATAGLRFVFAPIAGVLLSDGAADWLWPVAEELDIPVMLLAPGQHDAIERIAARHAGVRLALDHMNLGAAAIDDAVGPDVEALVRLSALPNMSVKLSALPCYSSEPYPYPALHAHVERVIDAFGPGRCFWGSDLSRLRGGYAELVSLFQRDLPFLTGDDLERVMGLNLSAWLGWSAAST